MGEAVGGARRAAEEGDGEFEVQGGEEMEGGVGDGGVEGDGLREEGVGEEEGVGGVEDRGLGGRCGSWEEGEGVSSLSRGLGWEGGIAYASLQESSQPIASMASSQPRCFFRRQV